MDSLEDVSPDDLRAALAAVDEKRPALRLVAAIAYQDGVTQGRLAEWVGVERKTIYNWLDRIDPDAIVDSVQDAPRPGRPRKLSPDQQEALAETLAAPPTDAGYDTNRWTAPLLQAHVESTFGVDYSLPSCRRILAEHDAE